MSSSAFASDLADPALGHGHALFATRIGICALAWNAQSVLAVQLPEVDAAATQARMLGELALRLEEGYAPPLSLWTQTTAPQRLPVCARQAVAGVQRLLAGRPGQREDAMEDAWATPSDSSVLGDMRAHDAPAEAGTAGLAQGTSALPQLLEVALDWHGVPDFARRVYALTRAIAPGQTRTYGDLAQELGGLGLARAVGQALGANPFAPVVPCHRVLAAGREPGGFSGGQGALTKLRMLELEGAAWGGTRSLFE
ncbi:methylated-DNA--[protein]-cysteine S-methyltransferase [Comamonas sp. GB3 AK4-5]|uniref:methylated-DNA--[protein]-cysteine S-methyltransferase n=1 Tax=Comamonas sp. GB3 AK4-5 TaxID=3231487 RepID=UPI00351EF6C3